MLKKNEIYPARITGYTAEGLGVCRIDGQVVFVHDALEGEEGDVLVLKVLRQEAYGKLLRRTVTSPCRQEPDCPYARHCGGCSLRHMTYEEELRFKSRKVRDALVRLGGAELEEVPILGAETTRHYRNKAIFPVGLTDGQADAGFYRARSHDLIPVERCLLQSPAADAAREAVVAWMRRYAVPVYDETAHAGLVRHIYVRSAGATGEVLVTLIVNGSRLPREGELVESLRAAVPGLRGVVLGENTRKGNAILGDSFRTLWGQGEIRDVLCGLEFQLSPRSFYQVNREQAQRLYGLAIQRAGLKETDTVLDLYCGTGTITLCLARACGQAIGVEVVPDAIDDAWENARRNGVENVRFFCGDAGEAAARLAREGVRPDVIVVDPPRKGISPEVVEAMAQMAPDRIVYVSCDPGTLGRDVKRLGQHGYTLASADAVDLFPRTHHVESCALLCRTQQ